MERLVKSGTKGLVRLFIFVTFIYSPQVFSSLNQRPLLKSKRVIVKKRQYAIKVGTTNFKGPNHVFIHKTNDKVEDVLKAFKQDPDVLYAVEDKVMGIVSTQVNDPFFDGQWALQGHGNNIELPFAWEITRGDEDIVIAVLDTGVTSHPDLDNKMLPGADFVSSSYMGNDGDGRDMDPSDPGDWVSMGDQCYDGMNYPSSWHGTHVSGIIGAETSNALGVAGINWKSKILPVRVLGKCGGYTSDIIDGLKWAAGIKVKGMPQNENPAKVINMSLGAQGECSTPMQEAINEVRKKGSLVVVAAGNSGQNIDYNSFSPANCQGVITVGAVNSEYEKSSYSNYGSRVDIMAPGGESYNGILSTINRGDSIPSTPGYASMAGTSMAAPHVAGIASLIYSVNKDLSVSQVIDIMKSTADSFLAGSNCDEVRCGHGIVNAYAAVDEALRVVGQVDQYEPKPTQNVSGPSNMSPQGGGGCASIDINGGDGPGPGDGQLLSLLLGMMIMLLPKFKKKH